MIPTTSTKPATFERAALAELADSLRGPILTPAAPGYEAAVTVWNGMVRKAPAVVAQPRDAADVAAAVRVAGRHGLLLSIKGGGHNIAGTALADGGLTLDMSGMRQARTDPAAGLAVVGAGCLLRHVDAATQEHGLAAPLGFVSETGVGGLTLGGGFGYLTRRFGWTVDNLVEAEVVTAEGEVLRASPDEHPDLLWALRGGGGNFGVVTELVLRVHPVGPEVTAGLVVWPLDHADAVLEAYRATTASAPRELTLALTMRLAPPAPFIPDAWRGRPVVGVVVCHTGPPSRAGQDLAPLRGLGQPIADLVTTKPYTAQQSMLDATQPKGLHYFWKSEFLPSLPPELLGELRAHAASITSPLSQVILFHIGGALNERAQDDGAVGNRDARYVSGAAGAWQPDDPEPDRHRAWVRSVWEALRPFSTGGNYVNFQGADEDASRVEAAYGANLARLRRVKAAYDPGNLFRMNRNIAPQPA